MAEGGSLTPLEISTKTKADMNAESIPLTTSRLRTGCGSGPASAVLRQARTLIYVSHLFSQFSENAWQFCLVLFLAAFSNYESLFLVSTYGLIAQLGVFIFGSTTGRLVDGKDRLMVAQIFILTENVAVLAATFCCYLLLLVGDNSNGRLDGEDIHRFQGVPTDPWTLLLVVSIHLFGATANIFDKGFLVAMERDWIVVMSTCMEHNDVPPNEPTETQKTWLSETNVTMKQIDLSCQIVAPAVAGFFVALVDDGTTESNGSDLRGAAVFVGILNALALLVEYICTFIVYHQIPQLSSKSQTGTSFTPIAQEEEEEEVVVVVGDAEAQQDTETLVSDNPIINEALADADRPEIKDEESRYSCDLGLARGLEVYMEQKVAWAGLSLALLYNNVLTFSGIMTAYLVWRGMRLDAIGLWRGVSSAAGLAGTFAYQISTQRLSVVSSGAWSILLQFTCLTLCYISLFINDYNLSLTMLIAGVCASRVGLWVFDISVTQLMQTYIPDDVRGLVGGVQQSLNSFFFIFSFIFGIIFPDPRHFYLLVGAGYCSVGIAALGYMICVYRKRNTFAQ